MPNSENPVIHEDFAPLEGSVPQEFLDRFRDPTKLSRYLNLIKERGNLTVGAMAKGAYTSEDTVKNLLNKRSKNPQLGTVAPVIYSSGGSFDEMYFPEGYEARIESATKTVKEMGDAQLAAQKESYENEIASIKETSERALAELNEAHKQQLLELNACHRQEITDLVTHHNEKAESERAYNEKILEVAIFDKRWFRILSVILGISNVLLLITLAVVLK